MTFAIAPAAHTIYMHHVENLVALSAVLATGIPVTGKLFTLCTTTSLPVKIVPRAKKSIIICQIPPANT